MSETQTPTRRPPREQSPRWYLLYFVLAAFDLLTVSFSLYLNHRLMQIYTDSIAVNERWAVRLGSYSSLRSHAAQVNAPGNDVFDTQAVEQESARLRQALAQFNAELARARDELGGDASPQQRALLLGDFNAIASAMQQMVSEANLIFNYFRSQQPREAGGRMATMDRKYAALNEAFTKLEGHVRDIQSGNFHEQQRLAQRLRRAEYAIAGAIVLMVLGVAWYGHRVAREMVAATRLREQLLVELRQARDELEQRVNERTAALRQTNESLNAQISERVAAEAQVREGERRLREIIDLVPHFIFAKDVEGRFILANRAVAQAYGVAPRQLEGKTDADFGGSAEWVRSSREADLAVLHSGSAQSSEAEHITDARGEQRIMATTRLPFMFSGTKLPAVLCVATDITERTHAQEQIRRLNDELEERVRLRTTELAAANKELEAFAYSVSHDLRSPLRGIDGWSQALVEDYSERLDETAKTYLNRVRGETQRMSHLIDDMLKLSRVTRAEMRREPVALSALAEEIVEALRRAQSERRVDVSVQPGLVAQGDANLLRQVLQNLLENAWKFTSKRSDARIEFGAETAQGKYAYYVRDNGAGFDMAYAGKLFGAFQRLHKASEFPGTGVGLATVQRIVRRHGGEIWVQSALGAGTTFRFTLGESA